MRKRCETGQRFLGRRQSLRPDRNHPKIAENRLILNNGICRYILLNDFLLPDKQFYAHL